MYLIAVPTPFRNDKNNRISPDISFVESAINSISMLLKRGDLVIIESTSPVGTTEHVKDMLASLRKDLEMPTEDERGDICIAYCPERVLPGNILHELQFNDRIIGGISKSCGEAARRFYKNFTNGDCHITNSRTAELAKLVENASRDSQIAFANEISMICDKLNINVWNLIKLANKHPRVNILNPGPGVGGHCIAVDPWFIVHGAPEESKFIECARNVNNTKPHWVINKIFKTLESLKKNNKANKHTIKVGFLGATFKPDIDDLRESPSLQIIENFSAEYSGETYLTEPNVPSISIEGVKACTIDKIINECHLIVILVKHKEFKNINFKKHNVVLDFVGAVND